MCGISGIIHIAEKARPVERAGLEAMARVLAGRGPDAEGIWLSEDRRVGLVNRRLATQDPRPEANQPLFSHDGRVVCVLNGEVYNHAQLRRELEAQGCSFGTRNDTEVLANGFRVWGEDLLQRIKGQFAFAVMDIAAGRVLVARDRMGICPMYYAEQGGALLFGSTVEALLTTGLVPRSMDVQAAYDYFVMSGASGGRTQYREVKALRAGHCLCFTVGERPVPRRYHQLTGERFAVGRDRTPEQWAEEIRHTLLHGTESCMLGDKEVGLYLSGGIDSVTAMALIRHLFPERTVKAFSANFLHCLSGEPQGEAFLAREAAERFGAEHHVVDISPEEIAAGVGTFDLPPDSILNTVLQRLAQCAASNGVNVALSGEGSDEMFFGYDHYFAALRYMKPEMADTLAAYDLRGRYAQGLKPGQCALADLFRGGGVDMDLDDDPGFFARRDEVRSARGYARDLQEELLAAVPGAEVDQQMMFLDHSQKLPECFLRRAEGPSMGAGVEMRFPFLWDDLVACLYHMPLELRVGDGSMKVMLRKAVEPFLPEEILNRAKSPFGLPSSRSEYFKNSKARFRKPAFQHFFWQRREQLSGLLLDGAYRREGLFAPGYAQSLLDAQADEETCSFSPALWKLWNYASWYENWVA